MRRPWHIWTAFALCLAVLLAAMAWVSVTTLRLDHAETEMRRHAVLEENVRLALWRMDSSLAGLVAQESSRPYFVYSAFYFPERAYNKMFAELRPNEVRMPSPLLTLDSQHILLHFQFEPDGGITSPQAPVGNMQDLAETGYKTHKEIIAAQRLLKQFGGQIGREELIGRLPETVPQPPPPEKIRVVPANNAADIALQQSVRSASEWRARSRQNVWSQNYAPQLAAAKRPVGTINVEPGIMMPLWFGDTLLLARRIIVDGRDYVQGCWLDWPQIKPWLYESIADLLPGAGLEPVKSGRCKGEARMLAALPVNVVPKEIPLGSVPARSTVIFSLAISWGCVILAAVAAGVLLQGAVALSERRGAFVSAVTHELRTPLTTFRLYSEMLAEGIVTDETKRRRYLDTLRREADRLSHLVENVLAYAGIERGSMAGRIEAVTIRDLLARIQDRLALHAQQAEMTLELQAAEAVLNARLSIDPAATEQILFNLVDNARKYAASATERVIHLELDVPDHFAVFRVRDHGPGVSAREARRLFRPFCKSAKDAANSAPGVGLGLALSRRLARSMGGDLSIDTTVTDGACFVLRLPIA